MKKKSLEEIFGYEGRNYDLTKLNPKLAAIVRERGRNCEQFLFYGDHTDEKIPKPYRESHRDYQDHRDHKDRHTDEGTGHQDYADHRDAPGNGHKDQ